MEHDKAALTRRSVLVGASLSLIAAAAEASEFVYRDWHFDTDAIPGQLSDPVIRSLRAQIDLVESLNIKPDIMTFFRHVSAKVEPSTLGFEAFYRAHTRRQPRFASIHRIFLSARVFPSEKPVLLRMLLFAYFDERVPNSWRLDQLPIYLEEAKRSGAFPTQSKMLYSPEDFFAISSSAVLWGHAADELAVRAKLRQKVPEFYAWIVKEFSPDGEL